MCNNVTSEARETKIRGNRIILPYQLRRFNNNITTNSFDHSSDNSTILKKIFDAKICRALLLGWILLRGQTCRTLLLGQEV